jgi:hypothetical protein
LSTERKGHKIAGQRIRVSGTHRPVCGISFLLVAVVVPGVFRIGLSRAPFSGDESQYALASVELFRSLAKSPSEWLRLLITISPYKPAALVWLGQFFVPLGSWVGSIDRALLLSTWCIQTLTLALLAGALWEIGGRQLGLPVLIVLICGSAPLFATLGGYYMVETLQTLVAAWFIFVMARAREWPPALTLGLLCVGSAYAPLTKQTTPLFCVWPGLIALLYALHRARTSHDWGWQTGAVRIALIAGVMQAAATSMWYWRNWQTSMAYVITFTRGPVAAIWGKEDSFAGTLRYWLATLPGTLILPVFAPVVLGLVASAIVHRAVTGRDDSGRYFTICAVAALLQVGTVLIAFSYSFNRELRYLLPMLPSAALVVCWSVAHFGSRLLTWLAAIAFAGQLGLTWGYIFLVLPPAPYIVMRGIDHDGRDARLLESIVVRTCYDTTPLRYLNVIAIDPAFRGDWLAPEPANYAAKRDARRNANGPACVYDYAGGSFLGERADTAFDDLVSQNVRYVITADPGVYAIPSKTYNRALDGEHFPLFWSELERSALFKAEPTLPEDPGIRIFRRVD